MLKVRPLMNPVKKNLRLYRGSIFSQDIMYKDERDIAYDMRDYGFFLRYGDYQWSQFNGKVQIYSQYAKVALDSDYTSQVLLGTSNNVAYQLELIPLTWGSPLDMEDEFYATSGIADDFDNGTEVPQQGCQVSCADTTFSSAGYIPATGKYLYVKLVASDGTIAYAMIVDKDEATELCPVMLLNTIPDDTRFIVNETFVAGVTMYLATFDTENVVRLCEGRLVISPELLTNEDLKI